MSLTEKLAKILLAIFIMVFSFTVLTSKVPESKYVKSTIDFLEDRQNTVMAFSGATIAASLAISALPDDFASPLADTIADLNVYFIFLSVIIFFEKLLVIEGTKIALTYIIPASCILYILSIVLKKESFQKFSNKLLILGIALILVIPFSTHFAESTCQDYMAYVDNTIEETNNGADKVNEVMATGNEEGTFFDRLSEAFKTAIQSITDLLTYFKNIVKKCVTSVAIMLVTNFVLPLMILILFRWLLKEVFGLNIPMPKIRIRLSRKQRETEDKELVSEEDDEI